jgi:hypothetical protein
MRRARKLITPRRLTAAGVAAAATALSVAVPAAAAAPSPVKARLGAYRAQARFAVSYAGAGTFATTYHGAPPNPGGSPDNNTARDTGTQKWRLHFRDRLAVGSCASAHEPLGGCRSQLALTGASGATRVTGHVDHTHLDGLYPALNVSERCAIAYATPAHANLAASVHFAFVRGRDAIAVTAMNPVADALLGLPPQCPGQGDSIDGLLDNYSTPGFSFAAGFGPDRWFTSASLLVPLRLLHRARLVTLRIGDTRAGAPPQDCAVAAAAYERCTTGGSWSGVLTLRAR